MIWWKAIHMQWLSLAFLPTFPHSKLRINLQLYTRFLITYPANTDSVL